MMIKLGRLSVLVATGALVVAGCGKANSSASSDTTTATTKKAEGFAATPSKKFDLSEPVKIVALISDKGKDPLAVPDFNDGARMAIKEINAAGGLGGHPIEFKAITTPPYGDITDSLNQALDDHPTVIMGPVSSTTLDTISTKIDKAGIPVLHDATAKEAALGGPNGSQWIFALRPYNSSMAVVAADLAANHLKAKKVGAMYLNAGFGTEGEKAAKKALEAAGVTVSPEVAFEATQTDFSKEVASMKGTDAVVDWGTPASLASTVTAFAQQGLEDTPHIGPGSIGFASFYTGVSAPKLLDNVYGVLDCNPVGDKRAPVKDWVARYKNEYGYLPSYASAELYDGVYLLRQVVEKAESAKPADIRDGLKKVDYTDGMCAQEYKNFDQNNVLFDEASTVKFESGMPVTIKRYTDINSKG